MVGGILTFVVMWFVDPTFQPAFELLTIRNKLFFPQTFY